MKRKYRREKEKYTISVEGSLGLLAVGYKGLRAWRLVKKEAKMKEDGK